MTVAAALYQSGRDVLGILLRALSNEPRNICTHRKKMSSLGRGFFSPGIYGQNHLYAKIVCVKPPFVDDHRQHFLSPGFCGTRATEASLRLRKDYEGDARSACYSSKKFLRNTVWYFENKGLIRTWSCQRSTHVESTSLDLAFFFARAASLPSICIAKSPYNSLHIQKPIYCLVLRREHEQSAPPPAGEAPKFAHFGFIIHAFRIMHKLLSPWLLFSGVIRPPSSTFSFFLWYEVLTSLVHGLGHVSRAIHNPSNATNHLLQHQRRNKNTFTIMIIGLPQRLNPIRVQIICLRHI